MAEEKKTTLEEAAEKFVYDWAGLTPKERRIAERAYIAGAEWQKEQMLKDAEDGVVYRYESYQRIATAIIVDIPRENLGNKVKIVIVKED